MINTFSVRLFAVKRLANQQSHNYEYQQIHSTRTQCGRWRSVLSDGLLL